VITSRSGRRLAVWLLLFQEEGFQKVLFRNSDNRIAAFSLAEVMVAIALFTTFSALLVTTWMAVTKAAINATSYAFTQNDQMRLVDYLKRDIRRASTIEIYDGATKVTGTSTFGSELRLTFSDYYTDSREEDNAFGTSTPALPTSGDTGITYGIPLTVRFYTAGGAAIRKEGGIRRTIGAKVGAFTTSFKYEDDGGVRCRVTYARPMWASTSQTLQRQMEFLCYPRFMLQK
jgi:type II secretory pathway pseudopilin PulG